MSHPSNRRRTLLVNRPMQNRIILSVAWAPAMAMLVTAGVLFMYCQTLESEAEAARQELPSLVPIYLTAIGFLGFAASFVLMTALRLSHRVVGPVAAFQRTFASIREGDFSSRAQLRPGDYLTGVADEVNGFLDWIEANRGQLAMTGVESDRTVADLAAADPASASSETMEEQSVEAS